MSADNLIYIQQNSKGRWVAQHWFASNEGKPDPDVAKDTYASMQLAIEMNHDRARETEYGFHIDESAYAAIQAERLESENFQEELTSLLNRFSKDSESGTPDYILAEFLLQQLTLWNNTIAARAVWRGESVELPALQTGKQRMAIFLEELTPLLKKYKETEAVGQPDAYLADYLVKQAELRNREL